MAEKKEKQVSEKKEQEAKKETAKKAAEKKPAPKKPAEKKPTEKKPAAEKKPAEKVIKNYHVSFRKDANKWQVKAANGERALRLFNTQEEAIEFAKKKAEKQDQSITIHKTTGKFRKQKY